MTRKEFVEKIENGRDIMFELKNRHYAIFTWEEDGIGIGETNKEETYNIYPDEETLVNSFLVNGVPLSDLAEQIIITDYS